MGTAEFLRARIPDEPDQIVSNLEPENTDVSAYYGLSRGRVLTEHEFKKMPGLEKTPYYPSLRITRQDGTFISVPRWASRDDVRRLAHSFHKPIRKAQADVTSTRRRLVTTSAADVEVRAVHWLWDGRIPRGTLALLAGREGLGKSTLAYWIAGRITRGELPGERQGTPAAVLIVATEDSREHTIVPRLIAAGADLALVQFLDVKADGLDLGVDLPRDLAELEKVAIDKKAALLILDPLMSRLDGALDTHKDADVRRALEPLVAIADRRDMAILGLIHHNKVQTSDPLTAVMGSKAFTAVARSVHTVVLDPDDDTEQRRLFGTVKNNLGRGDLSTLAFIIDGHAVPTSGGETAWTGQISWQGEHTRTIRDAIARAGDDADTRSMTAEASDWLLDRLSQHGGTDRSIDVKNAARSAGFSERTIARARERLNIEVRSEGFPRVTWWSLPGSQIEQLASTN